MLFGPLYKKTATGKVQEWSIEVVGAQFRTISGQVDGKKVTSEWTRCLSKNTGKVNETTPEEQAHKEAQARYDKQLDKGYHTNIESVDIAKFVKPMLAHKFENYFKEEAYNDVYSQPKLDGIRCIVNKDGMWTRGGKPIVSVPHIFLDLQNAFLFRPNIVFDGEIYSDRLKDNFNEIVSLAKKTKPTEEDLKNSADILQYHMYDIVSAAPFGRRIELIRQIAHISGPSIVPVDTVFVRNREDLDEIYGEYLEQGYEGQMIRFGDSFYEGKRSKNLLKRKEFQDEEFTIVSLNEGKGNYSGMIKSLTLTDGKVTFDSGIKGNQEYLKSLMGKEYSGKQATVRFQNKTPDNIPRFPVVYVIHETERW